MIYMSFIFCDLYVKKEIGKFLINVVHLIGPYHLNNPVRHEISVHQTSNLFFTFSVNSSSSYEASF